MDTAATGRFVSNVPLRGPPLLRAVVNHILAHPEQWDQRFFHCGTTHCVAGLCQIFAGFAINVLMTYQQAMDAVGLSSGDAHWLFCCTRTLPEIHHFAAEFLAGGDVVYGSTRGKLKPL